MVILIQAVAAERSKRQQDAADASTRQQIGRAVLEALAQRLNTEPLPGWSFNLEGQEIRISCFDGGSRQHIGAWTVDDEMKLVLGQAMTEWITAESIGRVIDEAVQITASFIVDFETGQGVKFGGRPAASSTKATRGTAGETVKLPPRV